MLVAWARGKGMSMKPCPVAGAIRTLSLFSSLRHTTGARDRKRPGPCIWVERHAHGVAI